MICRVAGTVESVEGPAVVLRPEGQPLAYEVLVPAYLAERLSGQVGARAEFVTLQYLESLNQGASFIPRLIGFASVRDRKFFELFTTVKGIGNRKALRAMAVEPAQIARAIQARDVIALKELPEIGKRLAETVVAELHGKVEPFLTPDEVSELDAAVKTPRAAGGAANEAIEVLIALGEPREQAERRVTLTLSRLSDERERSASEIVDLVFGRS